MIKSDRRTIKKGKKKRVKDLIWKGRNDEMKVRTFWREIELLLQWAGHYWEPCWFYQKADESGWRRNQQQREEEELPTKWGDRKCWCVSFSPECFPLLFWVWMNEWMEGEGTTWTLMFIYAFEIHSLYLYLVTRQFLNLKCLNQIRWYSSLSSSFHLIFTSQKSSL